MPQAERDELLKQGYGSWSKKDFTQFIKSCEKWGRDSMEQTSTEVESKTAEEVMDYAKVFWERYEELSNYESIIGAIT